MILNKSQRIIRTTFWAAFLMLTTFANAVMGQDEKIVIENGRTSAAKVMKSIEKQTRFRFAYSKTSFDTSKIIDISNTSLTVREALNELVRESNVRYVIQDDYIAFVPSVPVERVQVHTPRTNDQYQVNEKEQLSAASVERPQEIQKVVEIERVIEKEYPQSRSAYDPIDGFSNIQIAQPKWAIKTNLLYYAALTPNLGVEFAVGQKSTIELMGSYSWYGRDKKTLADTKQFVHSIYRAEYRHWLCERFSGHYIGGHALYGIYNVSGLKVPLLFEKDYRYHGTAIGAGFTYGYNLPIAKSLNLEFNIGVGAAYMKFDRYSCELCDKNPESKSKIYFGPTRAGINLVYLFK